MLIVMPIVKDVLIIFRVTALSVKLEEHLVYLPVHIGKTAMIISVSTYQMEGGGVPLASLINAVNVLILPQLALVVPKGIITIQLLFVFHVKSNVHQDIANQTKNAINVLHIITLINL
ncbi:hypothetical protein EIN_014650 [Entamoeba invadens IP1]|uniref:hypothetical protein n=1 Tax=Entamoeba invadens IP1 TaxID=370355 RepID=UPI0002C3D1C6|nr:hypothetical protein EIN_014650 [Entamoeba invadens IP1]ELP90366.1 hypothetical protein EIN_014650 [Entamoeba invadens IP1]|eukprot:XP_004257137.1 hypothetical protein EIN_014650 [Entamoeba invadens IP1]